MPPKATMSVEEAPTGVTEPHQRAEHLAGGGVWLVTA